MNEIRRFGKVGLLRGASWQWQQPNGRRLSCLDIIMDIEAFTKAKQQVSSGIYVKLLYLHKTMD